MFTAAKMIMQNIGNDIPTSAGTNSFKREKHVFAENTQPWK